MQVLCQVLSMADFVRRRHYRIQADTARLLRIPAESAASESAASESAVDIVLSPDVCQILPHIGGVPGLRECPEDCPQKLIVRHADIRLKINKSLRRTLSAAYIIGQRWTLADSSRLRRTPRTSGRVQRSPIIMAADMESSLPQPYAGLPSDLKNLLKPLKPWKALKPEKNLEKTLKRTKRPWKTLKKRYFSLGFQGFDLKLYLASIFWNYT